MALGFRVFFIVEVVTRSLNREALIMRKLLVIVFAFLNQGCFSDAGVPIEGVEHNYLVPNKYLSN